MFFYHSFTKWRRIDDDDDDDDIDRCTKLTSNARGEEMRDGSVKFEEPIVSKEKRGEWRQKREREREEGDQGKKYINGWR